MRVFQRKPSLLKKSLLLRVGIAMATIIGLAIIGMLSSVIIVETSEGFAAAINQAGTLRMQSYRIASSLVHGTAISTEESEAITRQLVEEFEDRLFSPRIHNVLSKGASQRVEKAYRTVERRWHESFLPQLKSYLEFTRSESGVGWDEKDRLSPQKVYYLLNVDDFVHDIHHFVKVLELDAEDKIQQLRIIQVITLILTLLVATISMYLTHANILIPLQDLLSCAGAARRGDFSVRSQYLSEDELGQLGQSFNVMAEDLSKLYAGLEARVQEKTADLERSKRSLELLYATTKRLSESAPTEEVLQELIRDIERLTGIRGGSVCLGHPGDRQAFRLATTLPLEDGKSRFGSSGCPQCLGDGTSNTITIPGPEGVGIRIFSTPIRDQKQQYGVLVLELPEDLDEGLEDWRQRLVESVASHIAMALNMVRQASRSRVLSLLEERSVIARELHDSLAQTLSYLKIQVSRLDKTLAADGGKEMALEISHVLRSALNGAYRELRELLTTFRLHINEAGLTAALEDTVLEYQQRSGIDIELINRIANCQLRPNAEIHVIQIIREALSNVIRHADAARSVVLLEYDIGGRVTILIEDDGRGIDDEGDMMQHYGLPIMRERAEWLGGELTIGESASGGTSVKLVFEAANSASLNYQETLLQRMRHE